MCKSLASRWVITVLSIGTAGQAIAGECEQLYHLKSELSAKVSLVESGDLEPKEVGNIVQEIRDAGGKYACGSVISIDNSDSFEIKYSDGGSDIFNLDGERLVSWVKYLKNGTSQIRNL